MQSVVGDADAPIVVELALNQIYKAFREVGRVMRTVALLRFLADSGLRAQGDRGHQQGRGLQRVGFTGATALIALIPAVGPVLASVAGPIFAAISPSVTNWLNQLADFGDDLLGQGTIAISAKQMVLLATRTPNSNFDGIGFKLESPLLSGDGASYKAYFGFVPA
jgi:hypothetical protein